jgi:hypothetical protein
MVRGAFSSFLAAAALGAAGSAWACNCFSPEMRAKTARETLELASLAAFGRIVEVRPDGVAMFLVLEPFKGVKPAAVLPIAPGPSCPERGVRAADERLLIVFESAATVCGTYEPEHFLLKEFRSSAPR